MSRTSDIVFSFDTTGSMRPAINQVRRVVTETVSRLFKDIDYLRIGIIAHGDYVDRENKITELPLTNNLETIRNFVSSVPITGGGDSPECYELVLNEARAFNWKGDDKALVLIGDEEPHNFGERHEGGGKVEYDWRYEANRLKDDGIKIYPVQALDRSNADYFYRGLAAISGTPRLTLDQFADMPDILMALAYQTAGQLYDFQNQIRNGERKVSAAVMRTLDQLAGTPEKMSKRSLTTGSRYQVIEVDHDMSIQGFVELNGLEFEKGRGFYEWTKPEIIQDYKEVIAQNIESGAIITGQRARSVLGVVEAEGGRQKNRSETHRGFVQSTSVNRKLIAGTKFLYEIKA